MKGILFKPEMALAVREDRKTQTRRIAPFPSWVNEIDAVGKWFHGLGEHPSRDCENKKCSHSYGKSMFTLMPKYRVGEVLYVKEGWYHPGPPASLARTPEDVIYRVDSCPQDVERWRSAMFMPEWAARTFIEITAVKVERLQDISEEDAKAEGVVSIFERFPNWSREQTFTSGGLMADRPYAASYACLWDEINDEKAAWKSNPFTWAYSLKKVQR